MPSLIPTTPPSLLSLAVVRLQVPEVVENGLSGGISHRLLTTDELINDTTDGSFQWQLLKGCVAREIALLREERAEK